MVLAHPCPPWEVRGAPAALGALTKEGVGDWCLSPKADASSLCEWSFPAPLFPLNPALLLSWSPHPGHPFHPCLDAWLSEHPLNGTGGCRLLPAALLGEECAGGSTFLHCVSSLALQITGKPLLPQGVLHHPCRQHTPCHQANLITLPPNLCAKVVRNARAIFQRKYESEQS